MTLNNLNEDVVSKVDVDNKEEPDQDDACPSNKTHFYHFKEHEHFMRLIENLPKNVKVLRDKEKSFEQFLFICDTYQEQPHLFDPFLQEIFDKLIEIVKESIKNIENGEQVNGVNADGTDTTSDYNTELINETFKYMHSLSKMRGFKKIVQFLPHETNDLEPILHLLDRQNINDSHTWQTRYMLLLWLSIVCMVPFDLNRFDAVGEGQNNLVMNRILNICTPYLFTSDKCQDAGAYVLAKFMSRLDLRQTVLPNFFEQLFENLRDAKKTDKNIKILGCLKCLASIFKYGKREDLLKYTLPILKVIIELDLLNTSHLALIRKFHIKIVQRIGITFFKVKIAKWRYNRGSRILMNNINGQSDALKNKNNEEFLKNQEIDDQNEGIPNEIEDIIEQLLTGLKDRDTIVRWSSAKGIGRITNRLPKEMGEDILTSVLDLFSFVEEDSTWHGGCLAIAELGRRGLLLPQQLHLVVPIIIKALVFDKKLGNYSLGRNVRDSACYVCWAFARAFDAKDFQPFVNQIAGTLLVVTVFDREVNCRRAASAAFQENVGRQGQFPHGIDILTKCDYYEVGQLQYCYLNLSVFIASFEEYRQLIIDHLLEYKFNHWDQSIRELTSQALFKLAPFCPDYIAFNAMPKLMKYSSSIDLNTRHGAILCLAELIHALCQHSTNNDSTNSGESIKKNFNWYFNSDITSELRTVISRIFDVKYLKGSSGEHMRPAICFFIKKLAISNIANRQSNESNTEGLFDENFLNECELFLNQCIEFNKESVQLAGAETVPYYCSLKLGSNENKRKESKLIQTYLHNVKSTNKEIVRSGYCLALGYMPHYLLSINQNFENVVDRLIEASKAFLGPIIATNNQNNLEIDNQLAKSEETGVAVDRPSNIHLKTELAAGWIQARRDSIRALINLLKGFNTRNELELVNMNNKIIMELFECFFYGLNDYSVDSKGDSGSKVREVSMEAIETLVNLCGKYNFNDLFNNKDLLCKLFGKIMQQAVERIDRTRNLAGKTFVSILYNKNIQINHFEFVTKLKELFKEDESNLMDWNVAHLTLPIFAKLLNLKEFQTQLLMGFIYSIGSLTESLVKSATSSFLKELQLLDSKDENKQDFRDIIENILDLCKNHLKNDRLATSLIKAVDLIVQNGLLNDKGLSDAHIPEKFLNAFLENVKLTRDMQKLIAYVDLFCDMLQFEEDRIRERCMIQLMIMLCHQYPRIRRTAASKLFEALINYTDNMFENPDDYDECINLLTETNWDEPLDKIRPIRNRICDLSKTPKPVLTIKK